MSSSNHPIHEIFKNEENFICETCQREFKTKRSLSSHKNHHKESYKNRSISTKEASIARSNQHASIREEYYLNPAHCSGCGDTLDFYKRRYTFCSKECSDKHSLKIGMYGKKHNQKTKDLLSAKNIAKYNDIKIEYYKNPSICPICNKEKSWEKRHKKTCSVECGRISSSIKMKNKIENGYNPQLHRGRHKRSYLELSFEDWLNKSSTEIVFIKEHPIKKYENGKYIKTYFIDFYFPELKLGIELDGTQHNKTIDDDIERDSYIKESCDISIIRISHKEYTAKTMIESIVKILNWSG